MKTKTLIVLALAIALLAACKSKTSTDYEVARMSTKQSDSAKMADSAKMLANVTNYAPEKLVKTADINFKVKDVRKTGDTISNLTKQFGGMVMHHQVQSNASATRDVHISDDSIMRIAVYNTAGEMTVRVPSEKLEDFMTTVSRMGIYVNVSKMDVDDESLDYLANQLRLKDREELLARQKAGTVKIKNPANVLALSDDMIEQKIQNMRTDAAVKFSTVSISFYQSDNIMKETIANDDPSAYDIPFFQRLKLAFENGWAIFMDLVIGAANLWMFIIAGIVIWRGFIYYKRRIKLLNAPGK
ncbi:MAG TPA: DUF4349 domain-containing protein [Mucilaginibacter sp.]|jgi:hypothetical protein|nr:DUF4349 domain-containing protein [Mucilaginibacter sp.]